MTDAAHPTTPSSPSDPSTPSDLGTPDALTEVDPADTASLHRVLRTRLLERLDVVRAVPEMYRGLVMDTPEDQITHARVTSAADAAVEQMRQTVLHLTPLADR